MVVVVVGRKHYLSSLCRDDSRFNLNFSSRNSSFSSSSSSRTCSETAEEAYSVESAARVARAARTAEIVLKGVVLTVVVAVRIRHHLLSLYRDDPLSSFRDSSSSSRIFLRAAGIVAKISLVAMAVSGSRQSPSSLGRDGSLPNLNFSSRNSSSSKRTFLRAAEGMSPAVLVLTE
jgi:hypothetical protein